MTPERQKAEELVNEFWNVLEYELPAERHFEQMKQCAIICVKNIIETYSNKDLIYPNEYSYWQKVLNELENM